MALRLPVVLSMKAADSMVSLKSVLWNDHANQIAISYKTFYYKRDFNIHLGVIRIRQTDYWNSPVLYAHVSVEGTQICPN